MTTMKSHNHRPLATKLGVLAGLLSTLTLTPALASASEPVVLTNAYNAPVSVETSANLAFVRPPLEDVTQVLRSQNVRFVNRSTVAATDVSFEVARNGATRIVDDRGTFAPGVTIARTIAHGDTALYNGASSDRDAETWSVLSVRFADGTSWNRPIGSKVANAK